MKTDVFPKQWRKTLKKSLYLLKCDTTVSKPNLVLMQKHTSRIIFNHFNFNWEMLFVKFPESNGLYKMLEIPKAS